MYYLLLGASIEGRGIAFKIILATFSMFALISVTAYSAKLISFLTNERIIIPFKTIDEFFQNDKYHISSIINSTFTKTPFYKLTEVFSQFLSSSSSFFYSFFALTCFFESGRNKKNSRNWSKTRNLPYPQWDINTHHFTRPSGIAYSLFQQKLATTLLWCTSQNLSRSFDT